MVIIREVVQQALTSGYLTVEAENQLRQLLKTKYDVEDLKAFMTLQQAAMEGQVKQQYRELIKESAKDKLPVQPVNLFEVDAKLSNGGMRDEG